MTQPKGTTVWRSFAAALAIWAAAPVGVTAQSATPDQALEQIREMILYARYREALEQAQTYLQRTDLGAHQRNLGLEVLATLHIALRDNASAQRALQELYSRDPQHQLSDPDASPPVLSAFGRARSSPPPALSIAVTNQTPAALERRGPPRIVLQVGQGRDAVAELRLRYRQGGDDEFSTVVMSIDAAGAASGRIPLLENGTDAYSVEYYVELRAPSDAILTTVGSSAEPLRLSVPEGQVIASSGDPSDPNTPVAGGDDLTWLWIVIGVAVVGGGVAAGVGIAMNVGGADGGSLGNIVLPLVSF